MGIFSDNLQEEVRLEYLRPAQVEAAKRRQPAIYVPCGALEWHGRHNAVGLDGLKAHEQLVGLAVRSGGVVYPPLYLGSGGGHIGWPSTHMVDWQPMRQILAELLHGFERDGYRKCILLSGHYPNRGAYLAAAAENYRQAGGMMRVLALIENQVPDVGGDHAAKFETSTMLYLHPRTVTVLTGEPEAGVGNWMDAQFKEHPCYGLVGIDPRRNATAEVGRVGTEALLRYLSDWLNE